MPEKPSSNKLLVKNLAFEATKNDLKQLFTYYFTHSISFYFNLIITNQKKIIRRSKER